MSHIVGKIVLFLWQVGHFPTDLCVKFCRDRRFTAVKSNALAELMNRASKIHWKNLSLTLNGRNSETKNDKNNPKVPKFSSCRGLSSTLSRKCGSTTLCGCLWVLEV